MQTAFDVERETALSIAAKGKAGKTIAKRNQVFFF